MYCTHVNVHHVMYTFLMYILRLYILLFVQCRVWYLWCVCTCNVYSSSGPVLYPRFIVIETLIFYNVRGPLISFVFLLPQRSHHHDQGRAHMQAPPMTSTEQPLSLLFVFHQFFHFLQIVFVAVDVLRSQKVFSAFGRPTHRAIGVASIVGHHLDRFSAILRGCLAVMASPLETIDPIVLACTLIFGWTLCQKEEEEEEEK